MTSLQLIGMVHALPLPGSPSYRPPSAAIVERAVEDAVVLEQSGFDAVLVENYGDAPFFADRVPPVTVASLARMVAAVRSSVDIPVGVNVLRNDAIAALSIAAACDARFIRVNVLSSMMYTDQGPIVGQAARLSRLRAALNPEIEVLADLFVKHATPPPGLRIEDAAGGSPRPGYGGRHHPLGTRDRAPGGSGHGAACPAGGSGRRADSRLGSNARDRPFVAPDRRRGDRRNVRKGSRQHTTPGGSWPSPGDGSGGSSGLSPPVAAPPASVSYVCDSLNIKC